MKKLIGILGVAVVALTLFMNATLMTDEVTKSTNSFIITEANATDGIFSEGVYYDCELTVSNNVLLQLLGITGGTIVGTGFNFETYTIKGRVKRCELSWNLLCIPSKCEPTGGTTEG